MKARVCERDALVGLRAEVLRPGMPRSAAEFDGDLLPTTLHFGVFDEATGDRCLACATFMASTWEGSPAWQLRGMATAPEVRGTGVGRLVLEAGESHLAASGARVLWCNARVVAIGFYERHGWTVVSEVFDVPTVGPHVRMVRRLVGGG